jgi:hypothetical protein
MKLYLISQDENDDYDTYDAFVVCAESEEDAKLIKPLNDKDECCGDWCQNIESIKVKYLGEAKEGSVRGVILGSFNAG